MIPRTPLSFIYHVTLVPPHRDELHHSIVHAFERYGITDEDFAKFGDYAPAPSAADFQTASFDVERAAYQIRGERSAQGLHAMIKAATELFRLLSPCLAYELAHGPAAQRVSPGRKQWLLGGLYDTLYSTQRDADPRVTGELASHLSEQAHWDLRSAWDVVHAALQQPPGRPGYTGLLPHTNAVCNALATEYALRSGCWSECW